MTSRAGRAWVDLRAMTRRDALRIAATTSLGMVSRSLFEARAANARGRSPVGGRIAMRVPWPLLSIDPHRLDDAAAAIFGDALFDTLYARDDSGAFVPSLAETAPEPDGANLRVRIRAGIMTARGRPFDVRDVVASLARARTLGARAWLADLPAPKIDGRSLLFATRDTSQLVRALGSPLVAMVPSAFSAETPDGTGPFKLTTRGDAFALVRNPVAARGPAFVDEIIVRSAPDLASSLRAFESGADDIGWLGSGLHEPRAGSRPFDFGAVGWPVLFTGKDALHWDAPGVAQRICDGIPHARLSHLAVGPAWSAEPVQTWGGPPTALVVREDSPWLVELAKAIAATISQPSHEVVVKLVSASELAQRRAARAHALALDVVRPVTPGAVGALVSLATADNAGRAAELVAHPPKLGNVPARALTRTLRCGVVGEIRVQGGRAPDLVVPPSSAAGGFDLGAALRSRTR